MWVTSDIHAHNDLGLCHDPKPERAAAGLDGIGGHHGHPCFHDAAKFHVPGICTLIGSHVKVGRDATNTLVLGALDLCEHETVVRFEAALAVLELHAIFLGARGDAVSVVVRLIVLGQHAEEDQQLLKLAALKFGERVDDRLLDVLVQEQEAVGLTHLPSHCHFCRSRSM